MRLGCVCVYSEMEKEVSGQHGMCLFVHRSGGMTVDGWCVGL